MSVGIDRGLLAGVICIVLMIITPADVPCQAARYSLDVAGGPNLPVGRAALVSNVSAALSLGFIHQIGNRTALITEVQKAGFSGGPHENRQGMTDISVFRWSLGVEVLLVPQSPSLWELRGRLTGGISTIVSDFIVDPARSPPFAKINDDVFVLSGGLQGSRSLGSLSLFLRVQPEMYFIGSALSELRSLNDEIGESGGLIGIPVQVGLRMNF